MKFKQLAVVLQILVVAVSLNACASKEEPVPAPVSENPVSEEPMSEEPVSEDPVSEEVLTMETEPALEIESVEEEPHPFADDPYFSFVEQYGIDLRSTEGMPMSEERASVETLVDVFYNWYDIMQSTEAAKLEYDDFAGRIGCDASKYRFDAASNSRVFSWYDAETGNSNIVAVFKLSEDTWKRTKVQAVLPSELDPQ